MAASYQTVDSPRRRCRARTRRSVGPPDQRLQATHAQRSICQRHPI